MKTEDFMRCAIESAREGVANNHGGPFGACIVGEWKNMARPIY